MKKKGVKSMRKGSIRIRTAAGVKYSSPLRDKADYEKVIKFLMAEQAEIAKNEQSKKAESPAKKAVKTFRDDLSTGFEAATVRG